MQIVVQLRRFGCHEIVALEQQFLSLDHLFIADAIYLDFIDKLVVLEILARFTGLQASLKVKGVGVRD